VPRVRFIEDTGNDTEAEDHVLVKT
jgi:hypothetical protein